MYYYKCDECGRFIGRNDNGAVSYVPYGSPDSLEPPDEIYVCGKCWNKTTDRLKSAGIAMTHDKKTLTISVAWLKPCKLFIEG